MDDATRKANQEAELNRMRQTAKKPRWEPNKAIKMQQDEIDRLLTCISDQDQLIGRLQGNVEGLTRQLESAKDELGENMEWRKHGAALSRQVSDLKQKLVTKNIIQQQLSELTKQHEQLKSDHTALKSENERLKGDIERRQDQKERLLQAEAAEYRDALQKTLAWCRENDLIMAIDSLGDQLEKYLKSTTAGASLLDRLKRQDAVIEEIKKNRAYRIKKKLLLKQNPDLDFREV
jgi:chromosome segregation ATPase